MKPLGVSAERRGSVFSEVIVWKSKQFNQLIVPFVHNGEHVPFGGRMNSVPKCSSTSCFLLFKGLSHGRYRNKRSTSRYSDRSHMVHAVIFNKLHSLGIEFFGSLPSHE